MATMQKVPYASLREVSEILDCHSSRNFGETGIREVSLDVYTGGVLPISYAITQVWHATHKACRSLLYLSSPAALKGTALLLVEAPRNKDIEIWLRLPTANTTIRVDSSRAGQFVLGTDFTYEDLRFWLPTDDYDIGDACLQKIGAVDNWVLNLHRKSSELRPIGIRLFLNATHWHPTKIEWKKSGSDQAVRIYEAHAMVAVDNVYTPTVISVSRPQDRYLSVMTLKYIAHGINLNENMFRHEDMSRLNLEMLNPQLQHTKEIVQSSLGELEELISSVARPTCRQTLADTICDEQPN